MKNVLTLSERADFVIAQQPNLGVLRPVIEKELLHLDLFYLLSQHAGDYPPMTFIGGTCLRLCYNASRYSEDLDFHAGPNFTPKAFDSMRLIIERYLSDRYNLTVEVKSPRLLREHPAYANTNASTWKIIVNTHPERKDLPSQRLHIDIANIPTYESQPRLIRPHYTEVPDGYDALLFTSSSRNEIMADKIIAVAARGSIKARDLWDVVWLLQNRVSVDLDLVRAKMLDHGIANFSVLLSNRINELETYFEMPLFSQEMSRFLETDRYRKTVQNPDFIDYLKSELNATLMSVLEQLDASTGEKTPFKM